MEVFPVPRRSRSAAVARLLCLALVLAAQALTAATVGKEEGGRVVLMRGEVDMRRKAQVPEEKQIASQEEIEAEAVKEAAESDSNTPVAQKEEAAREEAAAPEEAAEVAAESEQGAAEGEEGAAEGEEGAAAEGEEETAAEGDEAAPQGEEEAEGDEVAAEAEEEAGAEAAEEPEAGAVASRRLAVGAASEPGALTGDHLEAYLNGKVLSTGSHWRRRRVVQPGQELAFYNKIHWRFVRMNYNKMDSSSRMPMGHLADAATWERFDVVDSRRRRNGEVSFRNKAHGKFIKLWSTRMGVTDKRSTVPGNWRSERFAPIEQKDGTVGIFCPVHSRYWRMHNTFMDASLVAKNGMPANWGWEKFVLVEDTVPLVIGDVIGLHSRHHNRFLRLHKSFVDASDPCDANALSVLWSWEQWTVVDGGDGSIALHNKVHNRFLRAGPRMVSGHIAKNKLPANAKAERFDVINAGRGEFALFNEQTKKYVKINAAKRGDLSTPSSAEALPWTWKLERFTIFKIYDAELAASWIDLRKMKAKQSSTGWGGVASRAIDGNFNSHYSKGSCTHTKRDKNPWWEVTLPQTHTIYKIRITNRGDCCGARLDKFSILVDGKACASNQRIGQGQTSVVTCTATGTTVKVQLHKTEYLNFCEFGILGKVA